MLAIPTFLSLKLVTIYLFYSVSTRVLGKCIPLVLTRLRHVFVPLKTKSSIFIRFTENNQSKLRNIDIGVFKFSSESKIPWFQYRTKNIVSQFMFAMFAFC